MLLPDSTVWVDYFTERETPQTLLLSTAIAHNKVLAGNLVITEVLQGVRDDVKYEKIRSVICAKKYVQMATKPIAVKAAENYRLLRKRGITIRKTIDMIIATWCIENDFPLLHNDRDFDPIEEYLGLKIARC